mmetsp:Transcript_8164/g.15047  ORF Transcript_8164/g.15047 Transcript_8164/m.15047 type:complete len:132 (+) Transcript_8164:1326-1721(+)
MVHRPYVSSWIQVRATSETSSPASSPRVVNIAVGLSLPIGWANLLMVGSSRRRTFSDDDKLTTCSDPCDASKLARVAGYLVGSSILRLMRKSCLMRGLAMYFRQFCFAFDFCSCSALQGREFDIVNRSTSA